MQVQLHKTNLMQNSYNMIVERVVLIYTHNLMINSLFDYKLIRSILDNFNFV